MAEKTVPTVSEQKSETPREDTRGRTQYLRPPVDIYENKDGLTVVADLPGVDKSALRLNVEDEVLTIEGQTRSERPGDPVWSEFRLLNFYREFALPEEIDAEKINAELKHGVLTIQLPKAERAKPRQIDVKVS